MATPMVVDKLRFIGWFFLAIIVSGLCMSFAGKFLHGPLSIVHKLLALICLILLVRSAGALRAFATPTALPVAIAVFAAAFLTAFVTGVVQSIPSSAGPLWLNVHRVAAAVAAVACIIAARFIATAAHP
jgi:hypothetical protein